MHSEETLGERDSGNRHKRNPAIMEFMRPAPTIRAKNRFAAKEDREDLSAATSEYVAVFTSLRSDHPGVKTRMDLGTALHNAKSIAMKYGMRITSANILTSAIWPRGEAGS
jgi:hypothetical protein